MSEILAMVITLNERMRECAYNGVGERSAVIYLDYKYTANAEYVFFGDVCVFSSDEDDDAEITTIINILDNLSNIKKSKKYIEKYFTKAIGVKDFDVFKFIDKLNYKLEEKVSPYAMQLELKYIRPNLDDASFSFVYYGNTISDDVSSILSDNHLYSILDNLKCVCETAKVLYNMFKEMEEEYNKNHNELDFGFNHRYEKSI